MTQNYFLAYDTLGRVKTMTEDDGTVTTYYYSTEGYLSDGVPQSLYQIPGSINGQDGIFEYIIEVDGSCNHRLFRKVE